MLTGPIRNEVDKLWEAFWTGGIANPLTVIEQITYLLFIRHMDEIQTVKDQQKNLLGVEDPNPIYGSNEQDLRWSQFCNKDPESMFQLFTKAGGVFDQMKAMGDKDGVFSQFMKGATFMIPTPKLLDQVVQMIDKIKMDDRDTKGDLYEYLLSKIASAGTNGQFRTPRHIIKMMVELMQPGKEEQICDPSAGSAGFLVAAGEFIHEHHSDWLVDQKFLDHYNNGMFNGVEFDATMIRIAAMNLQLHGIEQPNLIFKDSLSEANADQKEKYTMILANPPFKGSLDYDGVETSLLKTVKTKKTELLFLALMLRMLKTGGRCAVIIPDGVLFGSSKAHKQIRQEIIETNKLEAVISMPSGVFKPYAGVSTAILIFTKTNSGGTDNVWFYDMQADGFSLDDKRNQLVEDLFTTEKQGEDYHGKCNIPDIIARYNSLDSEKDRKRTEQSFYVPFEEIKNNDWDLSVNRYKEIIYEEISYDVPADIIAEICQLDKDRKETLERLEDLLR
ncbi:type I restriction-modification system subunit M [Marinifilum flexuosum]|uniref:type I restriction-modification system subunit M n=1 Tax=Marinifilum flexuosum TaxID=1117708 RepID=UPI002493701F|nr:class I SAM-dependent DNA methyltransferase [Marinifilum flexuosum]